MIRVSDCEYEIEHGLLACFVHLRIPVLLKDAAAVSKGVADGRVELRDDLL